MRKITLGTRTGHNVEGYKLQYYSETETLVVAGNIYEHPHLLNNE